MWPSIQTIAIGMTRIDHVSARLDSGVEFSYGWLELGPKYPPPFVPNCLMATIGATTPRAIVCSFPSTVVAFAAPWKVIGEPCHISTVPTSSASGSSTRTFARTRSR